MPDGFLKISAVNLNIPAGYIRQSFLILIPSLLKYQDRLINMLSGAEFSCAVIYTQFERHIHTRIFAS